MWNRNQNEKITSINLAYFQLKQICFMKCYLELLGQMDSSYCQKLFASRALYKQL